MLQMTSKFKAVSDLLSSKADDANSDDRPMH